MGRPDFPRSIVDFQQRFPDDAACLDYLAASRWPKGFRCPACGSERAWVLERRHLWECSECHRQASVTAGTVMHGSHTSLRLWFWAAYLVATHTPGISAVQLQRQLGISRYETAWLMLQKLRRAMVAPEREPLRDEVEVDETLVGGRREGRHVARRHGEKALVGVIVEVRGPGSGRLRLEVLPDASQRTLTPWVSRLVAPATIVHTDGWKGYDRLTDAGFRHRPLLQRRDHPDRQKLLPRAHRASANLKTWLQGTHRGVSPEHLQVYLDEFVFRHNRRRTPMAAFQTLLGLGAAHGPTTYSQMTSGKAAA
jgi:transposase-like protein